MKRSLILAAILGASTLAGLGYLSYISRENGPAQDCTAHDPITIVQESSTHFTLSHPGGYIPATLYTLIAHAQQIARQHPSTGYRITTGLITPNATDNHARITLMLSGTSGKLTDISTLSEDCIFCHPTTTVVYEDAVVRVITKPGNRPGTDILIIPKRHMANIDALNFNDQADRELIMHIADVAQKLAHKLTDPSAGYTLMSNSGIFQGVGHLHIHFKSSATLK